jgi:hypothetical protein
MFFAIYVLFAIKTQHRKITNIYRKCTPHTIRSTGSNGLRDWLNKRKLSMPFALPIVWRKQKKTLQ